VFWNERALPVCLRLTIIATTMVASAHKSASLEDPASFNALVEDFLTRHALWPKA
jgi:hypothetical protein